MNTVIVRPLAVDEAGEWEHTEPDAALLPGELGVKPLARKVRELFGYDGPLGFTVEGNTVGWR
jgi:hypothetical protein